MRISVDDGCASDVRVAKLAKKYGIEAIFYWPVDWHSLAFVNGYEPLSWLFARAIARDFEIGSHTISHRHLTKLFEEEAKYEIEMSRYMLEDMFETNIYKFCPPRGYTNKSLTEFTINHYETQRLTKDKGLVHIHPNSGVNGNKPWRQCIDENTTEIWGHSHEFDKYGLWDELEEVLREGR